MPRKDTKAKSQKANFESIASVISTMQIYPAEADADIEKLRVAVWEEFSPASPYQEFLTEEIIQRMLESMRQRQLWKSLLETAFQATTRTALGLTLDDVNGVGQWNSEEVELYHKVISEGRDAAAIKALDRQLADYGTSLDRIQLDAHRSVASDLEVINTRLDLLEKKLRQLRKSISDIQAQQRRELSKAEI